MQDIAAGGGLTKPPEPTRPCPGTRSGAAKEPQGPERAPKDHAHQVLKAGGGGRGESA